MRIGGTSEVAWMQICEPTDKEKGHYSIEIHDGKKSHSRTFDLSGQGKWKLNCSEFYIRFLDKIIDSSIMLLTSCNVFLHSYSIH